MRWSQGEWSERRIVQAVLETGKFYALPYGPSGTAPEGDVRAYELYFERLEKAGLGRLKRPDLLVFSADRRNDVDLLVEALGGLSELPFQSEDEPDMKALLKASVVAIECENSLWECQRMPDFGTKLSPQTRLGGRPGLKKTSVLPTIILKEEDRNPLASWQTARSVPIHIWHVFFDMAFGIEFSEAQRLISDGLIEPTKQVFQAPGGATSTEVIYKIYYQYAYHLGSSTEEPTLVADYIKDKNGHILPFVRFEGGKLSISSAASDILGRLVAVGAKS